MIVDVETGGINPETDALLEIAAVPTYFNKNNELSFSACYSAHIKAYPGTNIDPESLKFNKIDPDHPFRLAENESSALKNIFDEISLHIKAQHCSRAVLVGHNAWFDLLFLKAAIARNKLKSPFHAFTCFDTATLSGFCLKQTVLAIALKEAGIEFNPNEAHSAIYDAKKTAELFCYLVNQADLK